MCSANVAPTPAPAQAADKEGVAQAHTFRSKSLRKPRPCQWCHQPVHAQASCCRVCKYVCHSACESKVSGAVELADPANAEQLLAHLQSSLHSVELTPIKHRRATNVTRPISVHCLRLERMLYLLVAMKVL
ncbi:hypothetical protein ABMA28_013552 [Loxostege sticticalis]|uniref:Phorbol-ester/DAG-type domain-containing protein n=1 Tax=Loxostege sticticalis TaxID=481309 RepID=A0ABD0TIS2_LOXSC